MLKLQILGSKSFTRLLVWVQVVTRNMICIPIACVCKKFKQIQSITARRVWVFPLLNLHSQNDKVPFIDPHHHPKFGAKSQKQP